MKILLTLDFPPEKGGIQRYLSDIVKHYYSCNDYVLVGCSKRIKKSSPHFNCNVHYYSIVPSIANKKFSLLSMVAPLLRLILKSRGRAEVFAGNVYAAIPAFILSFFMKLRYSVYCHGTELLPLTKMNAKSFLLKNVLNRATRLYYNSYFTANLLSDYGFRRCFTYAPPRIDQSLISCQKRTLHNPVRLLSVGRLVEHKGHRVLINAVKNLPDHLNWTLAIVGDGPQHRSLSEQIIHLSLQNKITIEQSLTDSQLDSLYHDSDIFICPSLDTKDGVEGFGIVLLEAMAWGIPIIASKAGAIPEVLAAGFCGKLVTPANHQELAVAIEELISNSELRQCFSERARDYLVRNYVWK